MIRGFLGLCLFAGCVTLCDMATETTTEKIARLRTLLESGVTSTTVDGESASFDHDSVRREIARLEEQVGKRQRRARILTINMSR